ncbi:hypothetical protein ACFQ1L_09670 [Phytohabitans flavus]|uniref:hypothetical protein n=1 Tax=Phytohabitans flavus TaxID=1076124 RepID=UPI00363C6BC5
MHPVTEKKGTLMKIRNIRRSLAIFGVAVATAVAVIAAPTAAQAHGSKHRGFELPGLLTLSPKSGALTTAPVATFSTTKACPSNYRASGVVALQQDGEPKFLSGNFVPTTAKPSGTLDDALIFTVLTNDITTGWYEIDVLCYNDAFEWVRGNVNAIKIDVEAGTWRVLV